MSPMSSSGSDKSADGRFVVVEGGKTRAESVEMCARGDVPHALSTFAGIWLGRE